MHKNAARFEYKVGDREYLFFCNIDAPLGEAYDALAKFKSYIAEMIRANAEAEKKAEEAKKQTDSAPTPQ